MSDRPFDVTNLSELEIRTSPDNPRWATIRIHFDVRAFGVNAWTADRAGQELIEEHDEMGRRAGRHEELYFVSAGHATFTVGGQEIDAPAGTLVFVRDPATRRAARAREPETTVLVVGGQPGKAFEPARWEAGARALRFFGTGEYEQAVEELARVHAEQPEEAGVLYNLACAESMSGRHEDAIEHLRRAVELDDSFAGLARSDTDFDPIRARPGFDSAIAGETDAGGEPA